VSFTGSTAVGRLVNQNAAPYFKKVHLEMGGKNCIMIMDDANLDLALEGCLWGGFGTTGQRCTAASRVIVHERVHDRFVEQFVARATALRVGNGLDPKSQVGPSVSDKQLAKVMSYVEIGKSEGRLVAGGGRPDGFETGNFVAPTVFADVAPDARIFQEEIFGPVVAITPFDTDEEALALANDTKYGLAAYVWTSDLKRAHNFAQSVEAGMVWLNSNNVRDLRTPFGGVKASGLGHEGGYRSIDFYTDQQAVHITLGAVHNPTFGKGA
jgi:5-carboxymethyl-2-hydroxymuconic-semialdehyde dehydrogenase